MDCGTCGKKYKLNKNGNCYRCNHKLGLSECSKCGELLPLVSFYEGRLGRCKECILAGIKKGPHWRWSIPDETLNKIVELYSIDKLSGIEISKRLEIPQAVVYRALNHKQTQKRSSKEHQHKLNENYFENIDTPEKAYWLGFIATDGNVYGTRIQINIIDIEHLEKFKGCIQSSAPIKETYKIDKKYNKKHKIYKFFFRSKKMVGDLEKHGITERKSFTVKPWEGPSELMPHYWRGCLDGDGWVSSKHTSCIGFCGNVNMVERWVEFVKQKTSKTIKIHKNSKIYVAVLNGRPELKKMIGILQYPTNLSLLRKQEEALKILELPDRIRDEGGVFRAGDCSASRGQEDEVV